MTNFIYPPGARTPIEYSDLTLSKSKEIFVIAKTHEFCEVIEIGKIEDGAEYIVIDVDIERAQIPENPVNYKERIFIEVSHISLMPSAYAIRADFPSLPHQNLKEFDSPKNLCLYEDSPEEVAIQWTALSYIEKIRQWLSLSASGELHQDSQALEPFLLNTLGTIILPNEIKNGDTLNVLIKEKNRYQWNFVVASNSDNKDINHHALCFECEPRLHGFVNKQPRTLLDLVKLLKSCNIDLIEKLKETADKVALYNKFLIVILSIPTKRYEYGEVEKIERFVFISTKTFAEIGIELNTIGTHNNKAYQLIATELYVENLEKIEIGVLKPYFKFDKEMASKISRTSNDSSITQIGVGAIGSSLFNILSRSGFGKHWTLIDDDVLLPHNLYRHSLLSLQTGEFKANAISFIANHNLGDPSFSNGYAERFGSSLSSELQSKLELSDLIIDTSASLIVGRSLSAMNEVKGRKISMFLNPKGDTLVVLSEDNQKKVKLTELEMLYYKAIKDISLLNDHFENSNGARVRYGNSCRDISNLIPNEYFGIFSSIAANVIKNLNTESKAFVRLWRLTKNMSIDFQDINVSSFDRFLVNDWEVAIDSSLIVKIKNERSNALPNETGGILIGSFDMSLKKIYIVDSIFSPKDSKEYPNAYYRGIEGVATKLADVEELTNGFLTYVGEWHSHPNNCSSQQSSDDLKLFEWISNLMNKMGLPGTMLIVAEKELGVYVKPFI